MALYRCLPCGKNFEATRTNDAPLECPNCQAKGEANSAPVVTIHYDPPSGQPGRGSNHAACDEKLTVGRSGMGFSGEIAAVNCPKCRETPVFQLGNNPGMLELDFKKI